MADDIEAARSGDPEAFRRVIEPHKRELKAHCYRMAGSWQDAEDLLQESMLRAWKGIGGFEGRSSVRTWLYRVATSACLDALDKRVERTLPWAMGPATDPAEVVGPPRLDPIWIGPAPGAWDEDTSPEARMSARESVAFAFLTVLQRLPPKQRAVLILRDVLGWQAAECAELLEITVAAVNSALQRARETLGKQEGGQKEESEEDRRLLQRYVQAWETAEVGALVALLHEDSVLSMPPMTAWFAGPAAIGASVGAMVLTPEARGRFKLVETRANGRPAYATYQLEGGEHRALGIQVLGLEEGKVKEITSFLDPSLFPHFGLPMVWTGG